MNGLLLVNLGTPDAPTTPAVRRYLAEFLSDPRVLDIHPVARWLLLHGVILRTRPAKSAAAYRKVWTERGSPLLVHSQELARAVAERLGADWHVELAMRYGSPPLAAALDRLEAAGAGRVVVFPLYPQYASSTTGADGSCCAGEDGIAVDGGDGRGEGGLWDGDKGGHAGTPRQYAGRANPCRSSFDCAGYGSAQDGGCSVEDCE